MFVTSLLSTKGGVGKTTLAANLGGFCADAGLKVLLIDMDPVQPSLSSYYPMAEEVSGGIFDLIAHNQTDPEKIISRTSIPNLSLILSNDPNNQLINLLLQAPDGRLRLAHLLKAFSDQFDLILIDTQGARSVMLEMVVLASDLAVSPLQPNMLSAREFNRGTLQMLDGLRPYSRLGLNIPPIKVVVNCLDATNDARAIHLAIRQTFAESDEIDVAQSTVPASVVFRQASTSGMSAHRVEYKQPSNRRAPSALQIIRELAIELFPRWSDRFVVMTEDAIEARVKGVH
ncbi:Chromosome partitioning related protein [Pseudomonas caricapapayae]|uniref:Chromosome partitioning related protein n=1 Tax=Pseudomonas caricapapayae TaxID=46678 RepID=A0A0P9KJK6_9PSED|nr:ParA family protein [Pseudomonas caricapapayae]KAA8691305.1 ParA family protein [Pseudomonas caricapapayae]KPW62778.1 Chromosome partitioning related protein [Pseudomonas caricapapayae]RMM05561.1 Chromosome partitioning related protein [Pseudomonas caricapapayae]RMV77765.1 Chromosome partitioning related protein [Pseudomonas caricapapayae]RMV97802.1 Chromosome partitioning related protein [Pseudomonas caricapapayae]